MLLRIRVYDPVIMKALPFFTTLARPSRSPHCPLFTNSFLAATLVIEGSVGEFTCGSVQLGLLVISDVRSLGSMSVLIDKTSAIRFSMARPSAPCQAARIYPTKAIPSVRAALSVQLSA